MSIRRQAVSLAWVVSAALVLGACGGDSLVGPSSSARSVSLDGTVLGGVGGSSAGISAFGATTEHAFVVTVLEDPAISVAVGADGTFTLRGLPEDGFTLIFEAVDGTLLGQIHFSEVRPNQEITITVALVDGQMELQEEQRNGIGHGDLEIQGDIDEAVTVDGSSDTLFIISGYPVVVRPGVTTIRRGNEALTVDDLSAGDQVHVKGVYLALAAGTDPADQQVLAHEIKLQEDAEEDDDDSGSGSGDEKITICHKQKKTLTVGRSAWPGHQGHGDTMGACS